MISQRDIGWAAGLLDGEGCFTLARSKTYRYPRIVCNMTDKEPLDKLQQLFGGNVHTIKRNVLYKQAWCWEVSGSRAVGIMLTLWSLLCPRRQAKIREIVTEWKSKVPYRTAKCRKGHEFTPEQTTYTYRIKEGKRKKYRLCRVCLAANGDSRATAANYEDAKLFGSPSA